MGNEIVNIIPSRCVTLMKCKINKKESHGEVYPKVDRDDESVDKQCRELVDGARGNIILEDSNITLSREHDGKDL